MPTCEKPAMRGHDGLSVIVRLGGSEQEDNIPPSLRLQHHLSVIRRAHMEAVSLGGRHGVNADALAQHFARRHRAAFAGGLA